MSIQLALLKSGEEVIADIKEIRQEETDELQLDLLGNDPILSTEYIMKAIY